ncbi:MAG: DUF63 family protein [Candidatus Aenigmarchaeota archaeon]|nr:DUF63 family protein [Candidatus Aenigmarchaeota archaeon]
MPVLVDLIDNYIVNPLTAPTYSFSPSVTFVHTLLIISVAYVLYVVFRKYVGIDRKLAFALSSFMFLSAAVRVLQDMGSINITILETPLRYVLLLSLFLASFAFSMFVKKYAKVEYWKTFSAIALIPAFIITYFIFSRAQNLIGVFYVAASFAASSYLVYMLHKKLPKLITKENFYILAAHMLDASSTFVSIAFFGYREQHFLPTFLMGIFGPIVMYPLKLLVIGFVLYSFDREIKDKQARSFFKIIVLMLGLAPGLRDTLRLSVLT